MKSPRFVVALVSLTVLVSSGLAQARQLPAVTVRDLGTLGGQTGLAIAVNRHGHAVGQSQAPDGTNHATLWKNGAVIDLAPSCGGCASSIAFALNDLDQAVGYVVGSAVRAVMFANGTVTTLPLQAPTDLGSTAYDINNRGEIVGTIVDATGFSHGVMWPSATSVPQNTGLYLAIGINDSGVVAGALATPCNIHAGISQNGIAQDAEPGMNPCLLAVGASINAQSVVAGQILLPTGTRAATWFGGVRTELAPLPGFTRSSTDVHGLNDFGDVSGNSTSGPCPSQATAWLAEGTVALPALSSGGGCHTTAALGISRNALVVGISIDGGVQRPVMWDIDVDREAPEITVNAATPAISPANGKLVPVTFTGTIIDEKSGVASVTFKITDEYGAVQPSGTITLDASGNFSITVMLEARRNGNDLDGRKYEFAVIATDRKGYAASAAASSVVLHDQRK